jgi:hypothetical protein
VLLAHLYPLRNISMLCLQRMPGITPGVVLGLSAALPQLQLLQIVDCDNLMENADDEQQPSWEGSDLQLARAVLRDAAARGSRVPCRVLVFPRGLAHARWWQDYAAEYVTAHRQHF